VGASKADRAGWKQVKPKSNAGTTMYPFVNTDGSIIWHPRVTSHTGVIDKPALVQWSARMERDGILGELEEWINEKGEPDLSKFLGKVMSMRNAEWRWRKKKDAAADIGTSAHKWIHWYIRRELGIEDKEPVVLPGASRAIDGFNSWWKRVGPEPIYAEQTVFCTAERYAGTLDFKARLTWSDGTRRVVIVDWKTSKRNNEKDSDGRDKVVYDEAILQNHAYRFADSWTAMNGDKSAGGIIVRLAKEEDDTIPFEAVEIPWDKSAWSAYKAARDVWEWLRLRSGLTIGGPWA